MNKLAIMLLAIIFVSACIGGEQPTTVEGKGLEITSLTADQSEIQSGRTIRISMEVENSGGYIVKDDKSLAFLIAPGDWLFSDSSEFQDFGKDLDPVDIVRDIPADTDQVTWRLVSPTISSGQTRTDEFEARVYYDYKTTITGNVWLYSEGEFEAVKNAGGSYNKASFSSSEGPIKIEVTITPDPAVVSSADRIFTMKLKISNVGEGTIYRSSAINYGSASIRIDPLDLNIVDIDIDSDFDISSDCLGNQELIRGRDLTVTCDVTVSSGQIPPAKQSFPVKIEASYGYFKSSRLSVNVLGR